MKSLEGLKFHHKYFVSSAAEGYGGLPVLVFGKPRRDNPTEEQTRIYRMNEQIVNELGGVMRNTIYDYYNIDINAPFTDEEVTQIIEYVKENLTDYEFVEYWNGAGCYSLSVSIKRK